MAESESSRNAVEPVRSTKIPYWRLVFDDAGITPEVADFKYAGSGTAEDPYLVQWIPNDPRNPMAFSSVTKWFITMVVSIVTLAVAMVSSAYTGGLVEIMEDFRISKNELFGRRVLFIGTYAGLTAFNAGCAGAQNIWTLLILRFFAGSFGSSPLTNAGGTIADTFPAAQRGLAMAVFAAAPFLGPVLGPIIGGFLGMNAGWRWVMGFLAAFAGLLWIVGIFLLPETYAPVLLRARAAKLSGTTGKHYVSKIDHERGKVTLGASLATALSRPWVLLLKEPIVLLLSIYMAIIYGTLYMLFAALPIVYQVDRGWNQGVGGLAFLGIMVGMLLAIAYTIPANNRYIRVQEENGGNAPPEARLPPAQLASVVIPIGLLWFAWTNYPSIHWIVSIAAGVPFGFGMVLLFLSVLNYLIDSYTIFAASVLAANSVLRSIFGAVFPLFTTYMYNDLGIHWASSIPAFLSLACLPFPFLFYRHGPAIRARCKFAAQSEAFMARLRDEAAELEKEAETERQESNNRGLERDPSTGGDTMAVDDSADTPVTATHSRDTAAAGGRKSYEGNPYEIDRVNTQRSFA